MSHQEVIQYLPVDKVECEGQVREPVTDESVIGTARSIQEIGLQQPIRVRCDGARFVVVDGERRLRAARLIKLPEIAAIVDEKPLCEGEILQRQLICNVQRSDLSPCEKARGIQRLLDATKWSAADAAGKLGISSGTAARLLALLKLPDDIRRSVEDGTIPASAGYELSRVCEPEKQAELARQLSEGRLTRDGLTGALKSQRKGTSKKTSQSKRVTAQLAGGQSVTVTGTALTLERLIELLETILGQARRARAKGVDLKSFIRSLKEAT